MKNQVLSITHLFVICCLALTGTAQSIAKTQTQSVWLPSTFKIDGNATEWNNNFQCFNKNVALYCTIANNQDYLYLVAQATYPVIIKKLIAGGIQFTICKSGERGEINPFAVTFPSITFRYQSELYQDLNFFKASNKKDSLIKHMNSILLKANKLIRLKGGTTTADSISIYNQIGIKAALRFEGNLRLTCEMLIPLNFIGIRSLQLPIAYNIMLEGSSGIKAVKVGKNVTVTDVPIGMTNDATFQVLNFPTDFWGACKLAQP